MAGNRRPAFAFNSADARRCYNRLTDGNCVRNGNAGNDGPPPTKIYLWDPDNSSSKYLDTATAMNPVTGIKKEIPVEQDDDLNNFTDIFFDEELDEQLSELEKEKEKEMKEIDDNYKEVKDLLFKKNKLLQENLKYLNEEKKKRFQGMLEDTYNSFTKTFNCRETTLHDLAENEDPVDLQVAKNHVVRMSYAEKNGVKEVEIEELSLPDCIVAIPKKPIESKAKSIDKASSSAPSTTKKAVEATSTKSQSLPKTVRKTRRKMTNTRQPK